MGFFALILVFVAIWKMTNQISDHLDAQVSHDTEQTVQAYHKAKRAPYVTIGDVKTILKRANKAGGKKAEYIVDKIDGTTVVDSSDGHEYVVNIENGRLWNYHLTPKLNGKTASVNKVWLAQHGK